MRVEYYISMINGIDKMRQRLNDAFEKTEPGKEVTIDYADACEFAALLDTEVKRLKNLEVED